MGDQIRAAKPDILAEIPLEQSSVVEASAGTGKTYTLEHLIVELVLERELAISNILVVTFTEKATSELVERVRAIFERLVEQTESDASEDEPHWRIGRPERRRLRDALFSFGRAPIYTIHGFCQRVLVEHAFSNERPFEQEHVEFQELFDEIFHECLREEFTSGRARSMLLEAYVAAQSVDDLRATLLASVSTSDRLEPRADFDRFADSMDAFDERLEDLAPVVEEMRRVFDEVDADGAINGNKRDKAYRQLRGLEAALAAHRREGMSAFARILQAECDAENPFGYLANESIFNKSHRDRFRGAWIERLEALAEFHFAPLPYILDEFVPLLEGRLEQYKSEHGVFTYDDMLTYVWEALRESDDLVETLRDEYEFALVDEFQDTDPVQWNIFERIFYESDGSNPCTLIGDPKQAIYGFRGADVQTYFDAARRVTSSDGAGGRDPIRLPDNYRSTPALIDAYNAILDPDVEEPFFTGRNDYPEFVGHGRPDKDFVDREGHDLVPIVVTNVRAREEEDLKSDGFQGAVFRAWSREIREMIDSDPDHPNYRLWDADEEAYRAIEANDIFVLTRSKKKGDQFAEYLRARGVPYAFYKREGLFQTPEARDWYELLHAVERPGDRSRRLKAWSTPFFDVGLDRAADVDEVVDENHELVERLNRWSRHAQSGRIGQLVHSVLDGSGLLRRLVFERHGRRELTNYEHLGESFVDWAQSDDLGIGEIVRRLGRYVEGEAEPEGRDANLQRLETEQQAVQILTMHKAKGLSAPVVFVYPGYGRGHRGPSRYYDDDGSRVLYFGTKGDSGAAGAIEAYQEQEDERLLYVAMTRAEGRLYLPYAEPEERGGSLRRSSSPAGPLVERLDAMLGDDPPDGFDVRNRRADSRPPDNLARRDRGNETAAVDVTRATEALGGFGVELSDDASFGELRAERRLFVESYSSVDRWTAEDAYASTEALDLAERDDSTADDREDVEPDGAPAGRRTGLCIHALLEELDYEAAHAAEEQETWRARDEVEEVFDAIVARFGMERHRADLERLVWRALTSPVRADGLDLPSIAATDRQTKELEFWYPIPGESGPTLQELVEHGGRSSPGAQEGYLRGFIDLLFEWDGRIFAADWKSNWRPGEQAYAPGNIARVVEERYHIQELFYATALARLVARAVDDADQLEDRYGGMMYLFVRGMDFSERARSPGVYFSRPGLEDLAEMERRTGEIVRQKLSDQRARIAEGAYDRWRAP